MKYRAIRDGINAANKKALKWVADIEDLKLIVFSDHHRGKRDGADDFVNCEKTYVKALNYYLENGYTLLLLGDVEELWENQAFEVLKAYQNILNIEREFHLRKRLIRVWGNHDDLWQFSDQVKLYFGKQFQGLNFYEAIELELRENNEFLGDILFLHGHQGTMMSSKMAGFSKFFVRFLWRPIQRVFKIPLSTPSKSKELRHKTDKAMDLWGSIRDNQLIVCGHTHQYIFGSNAVEDSGDESVYFNTGCCSYGNGNISGLEISNEKIRIIEWNIEASEPYHVAKKTVKEVLNA